MRLGLDMVGLSLLRCFKIMRYNIYHWFNGFVRVEYVADLHMYVKISGPIQLRMPGSLKNICPDADHLLWSIYITDSSGKFSQN